MGYNITSRGVGARQCRAPTRVPHQNDNRYTRKEQETSYVIRN
ncbi:hypothetical protein [Nostoc sphaeroides]|uniref:Uncharacterized protein n=1 Tax=Nostoc sphaeroides CCNUC1 TaxID=2653204 RepID=A0A5P8W9G6_9NOSO|nr:hypothetical protein [Nostoc sphaeroides]QFS49310.1 hypothetical protein GXM_06804 [Nostoc sphaeroides CCNUC1]